VFIAATSKSNHPLIMRQRRHFATELLLFIRCPIRKVATNQTEDPTMRNAFTFRAVVVLFFTLATSSAWADDFSDTVEVFKKAVPSSFFEKSYGYAVFPTIGKGGMGIGGAHGKGRVYAKGAHVGDTTMSQLTVGFQLGGQAFSQIIFFEDERAISNSAHRPRLSTLRRVRRLRLPPPAIPLALAVVRTMPNQSANTSAAWQSSPSPRAA
jgi:hypothetical protein